MEQGNGIVAVPCHQLKVYGSCSREQECRGTKELNFIYHAVLTSWPTKTNENTIEYTAYNRK